MKNVIIGVRVLLLSMLVSSNAMAETSWMTRIKAYWDPSARLESNGVDVSTRSLFTAIDGLDLATATDLLTVLSADSVRSAEALRSDPGLEVTHTLGMDPDYRATFFSYDQTMKIQLERAAAPQISLTPLSVAAGQFVKTVFSSRNDISQVEKAAKLAKLVFSKFAVVRPQDLKFMTAWCDNLKSGAVGVADKSSAQYKLIRAKASSCFQLSNALLAMPVDVSKPDELGSYPHLYLSILLAATDEYTADVIEQHFAFWMKEPLNKGRHVAAVIDSTKIDPAELRIPGATKHPLMILATAPILMEVSNGYTDSAHKILLSLMEHLSKHVDNRDWLYKTVLNPYYAHSTEDLGRKATQSNQHIYDYVRSLKAQIGRIALDDCKQNSNAYACWAADELIHTALKAEDEQLLCSRGVGWACSSLAYRLTLDEEAKKLSAQEIDEKLQLVKTQCHNNLVHSCVALSVLKKKFAAKFAKSKYECGKNSVEDCFLAGGEDADVSYMKTACDLGNADACQTVSIRFIENQNMAFGNVFMEKACKLQDQQNDIRPYDWDLCQKQGSS